MLIFSARSVRNGSPRDRRSRSVSASRSRCKYSTKFSAKNEWNRQHITIFSHSLQHAHHATMADLQWPSEHVVDVQKVLVILNHQNALSHVHAADPVPVHVQWMTKVTIKCKWRMKCTQWSLVPWFFRIFLAFKLIPSYSQQQWLQL